MKINKRNRLDSARVVDSPNFSDRLHEEISLLVIHNISLPPGEFGNHFVNDLCEYISVNENLDKLDWKELSEKSYAIDLLEQNQDKIDWQFLSLNKNAILILEQNQDYS